MIVLAVRIWAKADKVRETNALLSRFPARAQAEPGCLQYELFRGESDPTIFYFFEKWADQAALDQHNTQSYLKEFHARFSELLERPNEVTRLTLRRHS